MKIWRRRARVKLIIQLGGLCVDCGEDEHELLEFDHIVPLTDEQQEWRAKIGANARMVLNRKEAAEGLLELRCKRCNMRKSRNPKQGTLSLGLTANYVAPDGVPF